MAKKRRKRRKSHSRKKAGKSQRKVARIVMWWDGATYQIRAMDKSGHIIRHSSRKNEKDALRLVKQWVKRYKAPAVVKSSSHQTGASNRAKDVRRKALLPGKRISKSGKVYYEYRKNRSDKPGRKV